MGTKLLFSSVSLLIIKLYLLAYLQKGKNKFTSCRRFIGFMGCTELLTKQLQSDLSNKQYEVI